MVLGFAFVRSTTSQPKSKWNFLNSVSPSFRPALTSEPRYRYVRSTGRRPGSPKVTRIWSRRTFMCIGWKLLLVRTNRFIIGTRFPDGKQFGDEAPLDDQMRGAC